MSFAEQWFGSTRKGPHKIYYRKGYNGPTKSVVTSNLSNKRAALEKKGYNIVKVERA